MTLHPLMQLDRNANRLRQIVTILAKYGLADWLAHRHFDFLRNWLKSADGQTLEPLTTEARIRLVLTELGTTFIKIGQILSTRFDLIGPELAAELTHLQDHTPADAPEVARQIIEAELGQPVDELFAEFDDQAMASGSIGQVHRAVLKTGQEVVVKVQHAGIVEKVQLDLNLLTELARLTQRHVSQLRPYQPAALVREFRRQLLHELDFAHEKSNLEKLSMRFAADPMIRFPAVYPPFCTRRVLTMELLHGIKGNDVEALQKSGEDLTAFARRAGNMYLRMIFREGFYHADPHPGNYLLMPGGVLGLLDFGMVGRIDEQLRLDIEALLIAAATRDAREVTDAIIRLGSVPAEMDRDALQVEVEDFLVEYSDQSLQDFDLSGALQDMTSIIRRYQIVLPSRCSLLIKTMIVLEGAARTLNPHFSLAELTEPYYRKAMRTRYSPHRVLVRLQRDVRNWDCFLKGLPENLTDILERTRKGTFEIRHEHHRLEVSVNRLVLGLLTASLFLGASLILSQDQAQLPGLIVWIGVLSLFLSAALGYHLVRGIRKSDEQKRGR